MTIGFLACSKICSANFGGLSSLGSGQALEKGCYSVKVSYLGVEESGCGWGSCGASDS